ncbi:FMN-linked oxidoreductase [Mycena vitilis]|nr:FMN-linked oxidoreductase [Mycena vitilis]
MSIANTPAPNAPYFTPAQVPPSGTAKVPQPDGRPLPKLFEPITIRGLTFQNRIFLAPLCQYSAQDGHLTPWHTAHLGGIASRGPGLTFVEATAVLPEGRITPEDSGIWNDSHIEPLRQVVDFVHSQGQKIAIQLAHAGRKGSTVAPWLTGGATAGVEVGGWPDDTRAPSAIPYNEVFPKPKALTKEGIKEIVDAFVAGAKRALDAGIDVIEIHNAHGYLLHQFLTPVSNQRTDEYGGSFDNRIRLTLEIVDAVRAVIPDSMPLFLRISATDWLDDVFPREEWWTPEDTVKLAGILAKHGVDLLDVSTGGSHPKAKISPLSHEHAYQAPFSEMVKRAHGDAILVGCVGGIRDGNTANDVLKSDRADVIFIGRQFQKDPASVWTFAEQLGVTVKAANQIEWGFKGRGSSKVEAKAKA